MPTLTMLSGPSGSGKSTIAADLLKSDGNAVRINRDDLRKMSIPKWSPRREKWIIGAELNLAALASNMEQNIIIDDTNLSPRDEARWRNVAQAAGYKFVVVKPQVSMEECIRRDSLRGEKKVGRSVIERQFLLAGLWSIPEGKKTVIFDIDGTLADLEHRVPWITVGVVCPMCKGTGREERVRQGENLEPKAVDILCIGCNGLGKLNKKNHDMFYSLVYDDKPIEIVIKWIQACSPDFHILIVSGRSPEKCADDTIAWLKKYDIPYDHILMRRANMHGPDDEEKQLILDMILKVIPKENIAFVVDDRPSVVAMWKRNGLTVYPVRGRDDDKFYAVMNDLEANHPRPDLEDDLPKLLEKAIKAAEGSPQHPITTCSDECKAKYHEKPQFKRPLSSYIRQGVVRLQRWWNR